MAVSSLIVLSSCSESPDVRLTLCQDLTQLLLSPSEALQWKKHEPIIKGYEDMEMKIHFATADNSKQGTASCFYPYVQDDVGAETFQSPSSAYDTNPNKIILNGKVVDNKLLSQTVNQAMIMQGKQAIENAKEGIKEAGESAKEAGQKMMDSINKTINE